MPASAEDEVPELVMALLQVQLSKQPGLELVERHELELVLEEQQLQRALTPDGVRARFELGNLLRADFLVFLDHREEKDSQAIGFVISHTNSGLRVHRGAVLHDEKDPGSTVQQLSSLIVHTIDRYADGDHVVFAVPPFECKDLTFENTSLRSTIPTLLELELLRYDGVLVVELDEARTLAIELAVSKGPKQIEPRQVYFILGQYRSIKDDRASDKVNITFHVEQRNQALYTAPQTILTADEIVLFLNKQVSAVLQAASVDQDQPPIDSKHEAAVLAQRAETFRLIGEWDVALPLYDAAALLDPHNQVARVGLLEGFRKHLGWTLRDFKYLPMEHKNSMSEQLYYASLAVQQVKAIYAIGTIDMRAVHELHMISSEWPTRFFSNLDRLNRFENASELRVTICDLTASLIEHTLAFLESPDNFKHSNLGVWLSISHNCLRYIRNQARIVPERVGIYTVLFVEAIDTYVPRYGEDRCFEMQLYATRLMLESADWSKLSYNDYVLELKNSTAQHAQLVADVSAIVGTIKDRSSYDQASATLNDMTGLSHTQLKDILKVASDTLVRRQGISYREQQRKQENLHQEDPDAIALPKLTRIMTTLTCSDGAMEPKPYSPKYIQDWLVTPQGSEFVAAEQGVMQLLGEHEAERMSSSKILQLVWDGQYVWMRGADFIEAYDTSTGALQRIAGHDLTYAPTVESMLVPDQAGRVCILGFVKGHAGASRKWVELLDVVTAPSSEVIYEAHMNAETYSSQPAHRAYPPEWGFTFSEPEGEREMITNYLKKPMRIGLASKQVERMRKGWPHFYSLPVQHQNRVYFPYGCAGDRARDHIRILYIDLPDTAPSVFVDLGYRMTKSSMSYFDPYYQVAGIFENDLHLLTSHNGYEPAWIAVDLESKSAYELLTKWPENWTGKEKLINSRLYGMVLIADGQAFGVSLPDKQTWPLFKTEHLNETEKRSSRVWD